MTTASEARSWPRSAPTSSTPRTRPQARSARWPARASGRSAPSVPAHRPVSATIGDPFSGPATHGAKGRAHGGDRRRHRQGRGGCATLHREQRCDFGPRRALRPSASLPCCSPTAASISISSLAPGEAGFCRRDARHRRQGQRRADRTSLPRDALRRSSLQRRRAGSSRASQARCALTMFPSSGARARRAGLPRRAVPQWRAHRRNRCRRRARRPPGDRRALPADDLAASASRMVLRAGNRNEHYE